MNSNDEIGQKVLRGKWFIVFIGFLSAFVPMSTDLYLPALPDMIKTFNTKPEILNLTITLFFVFYAIGMLVWGPLSDKYGRKPILLTGMVIYAISSILCAFSVNVEMLIILRIIQAIGSGAAVSVATAMMKDVYTGKKLVSMLATVQSIAMTSPVVSPIIGAFILRYTSWKGVFIILTIVSIIAIVGGLLLTETIKKKTEGNLVQVFGNLVVVSKNKGFAVLIFIFAMPLLPLMAYVSMSSYIYIDGFRLSQQEYSYFFACAGIFLILGPMVYIRLAKKFKSSTLVSVSFIVLIIGGILMVMVGEKSPYIFLLCMIPTLMFGNMLRPPGTNLALAQQDGNIGSASSVISFSNTILESIGMFLITLNFGNKIMNIGVMYIVFTGISLILWLMFHKKSFIKQPKHN